MTAVRFRIIAEAQRQAMQSGIAQEVELMPSADPQAFPALHLFDEGDDPETGEAGTSRWDMTLRVTGYVEGGNGAEAHEALTLLDARLVEVMMTEPLLGGLVTEVEPGSLKIDVARLASKRRLAFDRDFIISYATLRGQPQSIEQGE